MNKKHPSIVRFYKSDEWKLARAIKIASVGGRCEKCGAIGTEVHHIIHLTPGNINDPSITVNQDNLMLLCNECHNKEHGRFGATKNYVFDEDGNLIKKNEK